MTLRARRAMGVGNDDGVHYSEDDKFFSECHPVAAAEDAVGDEEMGMTNLTSTIPQQYDSADIVHDVGNCVNVVGDMYNENGNVAQTEYRSSPLSSFYDEQLVEAAGDDGSYFYRSASSSQQQQRPPLSSLSSPSSGGPETMLVDDEDEYHHDYLTDLRWRTIEPRDRRRIQELHEEWFPVSYQQEFYDSLVHEKMPHTGEPLFTCVATLDKDQDDIERDKVGPNDTNGDNDDTEDTIVACVVGALVNANKLNSASRQLLISDVERHCRLFYIMTLGTVSNYRHAGIGTALVEKCIEQVMNDPCCGVLYLHVITLNHAAIRFYERLGFWRVQEIGM